MIELNETLAFDLPDDTDVRRVNTAAGPALQIRLTPMNAAYDDAFTVTILRQPQDDLNALWREEAPDERRLIFPSEPPAVLTISRERMAPGDPLQAAFFRLYLRLSPAQTARISTVCVSADPDEPLRHLLRLLDLWESTVVNGCLATQGGADKWVMERAMEEEQVTGNR